MSLTLVYRVIATRMRFVARARRYIVTCGYPTAGSSARSHILSGGGFNRVVIPGTRIGYSFFDHRGHGGRFPRELSPRRWQGANKESAGASYFL